MKKETTKEKVLALFSEAPGDYFSGERIAESLSVSRTAVWKAVNQLRAEGYELSGTSNKGYTLLTPADVLSSDLVVKSLSEEARAFFRVECAATVTSTNTLLKERAMSGEAEGLVLAAQAQTAGRGRQGRSFFSPKDTGLYFSLILKPTIEAVDAVLITAAASVSAARAAETVCPGLSKNDIKIKWVNDLFLRGRKTAGILTEGMLSMETGKLDFAVLGIGLNLYTPEGGWPEEIREVAGSLIADTAEEHRASGIRSRLVAEFLNEFLPLYRNLTERSFIQEYEKRQLVIGKTVEVMAGAPPYRTATPVGIDKDCHLLVHYDDDSENELHALNSGEVRVKPV